MTVNSCQINIQKGCWMYMYNFCKIDNQYCIGAILERNWLRQRFLLFKKYFSLCVELNDIWKAWKSLIVLREELTVWLLWEFFYSCSIHGGEFPQNYSCNVGLFCVTYILNTNAHLFIKCNIDSLYEWNN